MFLRNHWYVAAQPGEVKAEPLGRRIIGDAIVLYRRQDGRVVAMQDQCPHRKYALSKGRVEGDEIRCLYHGIKFDPSGRCTFIPGQDRLPANLCAKTYPVCERHGWIWIWMGDARAADESRIPDFGLNAHPDWRAVFGYLKIESDYRLILDNFLDLTHVGYVHVGTIGNAPVSAAQFELVSDEGMVRFNRRMQNVPPSPTFVKAMRYEAAVDRRTTSTWLPPGHFLNEVHASPAGSGDRGPHAIRFFVNNSLTPETETTTHYFYAVTRNFQLDAPEAGELLARENAAAFQEDKVVIELQQKMMQTENPPTPIMPIAADRGVLAMRRLLEKLEREERETPELARS
jgi:vanillate O-demethylase monooxygenase subunit